MRIRSTNIYLRKLIKELRKKRKEGAVYGYLAELLNKPGRKRIEVNLWKINKYANDGDIIVVPGKVLGYGNLNKKVTIIAWKFSGNSLEKIEKSGSKAISLYEYIRQNNRLNNSKIII